MEFTYTEPQTEFERLIGGHHHICAFGKIEAGDDQKFSDFLSSSTPPPRIPVYIDSIGGDVEAAIGIGKLIRERWHETSIGKLVLKPDSSTDVIVERQLIPGCCYSAATLIFISGLLRHFPNGSQFGVHQFSFKNPSPNDVSLSQSLSAKIAGHLADLEITAEFLELSSSIPSTELEIITVEKLSELGVVTDGVTGTEWTTHSKNHMLYVRGERHTIYGHQKIMLAYIKNVGFHFWAVIESQGREEELTTMSLVEITLNGEDRRIDISNRCIREVFGSYVNILSLLTLNEAREIACSDSFGVQVRFSNEADMFFGIDAMPTGDGKEQLATFFDILSDIPDQH